MAFSLLELLFSNIKIILCHLEVFTLNVIVFDVNIATHSLQFVYTYFFPGAIYLANYLLSCCMTSLCIYILGINLHVQNKENINKIL